MLNTQNVANKSNKMKYFVFLFIQPKAALKVTLKVKVEVQTMMKILLRAKEEISKCSTGLIPMVIFERICKLLQFISVPQLMLTALKSSRRRKRIPNYDANK